MQVTIADFIKKISESPDDSGHLVPVYLKLAPETRSGILKTLFGNLSSETAGFLTSLLSIFNPQIVTTIIGDIDRCGGTKLLVDRMNHCCGKRELSPLLNTLLRYGTFIKSKTISKRVRTWLSRVGPGTRDAIFENVAHVDSSDRTSFFITAAMSDVPDVVNRAKSFIERSDSPRDTVLKFYALTRTTSSLYRWFVGHLGTQPDDHLRQAIRVGATPNDRLTLESAATKLAADSTSPQAGRLARLLKNEIVLLKGGRKILIISNDFRERVALSKNLSSEYNIYEAESESTALKVLQTESPDLIIYSNQAIDPDMSALREIRKSYLKLPIVLTINEALQSKKKLVSSLNINDFLISPWSPGELLRSVENALKAELMKKNLQGRIQKIPRGDYVFKEREFGNACYIIRKGKVSILEHVEGVGEVELAELGPGDIFGEMALIDGTYRSASARAAEDLEVLTILRKDLECLIHQDPKFTIRLIKIFSDRLKHSNKLLESMISKTRKESS